MDVTNAKCSVRTVIRMQLSSTIKTLSEKSVSYDLSEHT